jgi:hypothetical protein
MGRKSFCGFPVSPLSHSWISAVNPERHEDDGAYLDDAFLLEQRIANADPT